MSSDAFPAECAAALKPRLGAAEAAVVIVIVVTVALLDTRGVSAARALVLVGDAGLLAVGLVRLRALRWRTGALRRAGEALLLPVPTA
ncbi:hypothetical protein [Streptomyces klenkii]